MTRPKILMKTWLFLTLWYSVDLIVLLVELLFLLKLHNIYTNTDDLSLGLHNPFIWIILVIHGTALTRYIRSRS